MLDSDLAPEARLKLPEVHEVDDAGDAVLVAQVGLWLVLRLGLKLGLQGPELGLRASCASKTVRTRSQHWRTLAADHGAACELALGNLCACCRVNLELCKHTCTVSRIPNFCNPLASHCTQELLTDHGGRLADLATYNVHTELLRNVLRV